MTVKQDLLLAFVDCVERNGARLAVPRTTVSLVAYRAFCRAPASCTLRSIPAARGAARRLPGVAAALGILPACVSGAF